MCSVIKKIELTICAALVCLMASGCATNPTVVPPERMQLATPNAGEEQRVNVGDKVIEQYSKYFWKYLAVSQTLTNSIFPSSVTVAEPMLAHYAPGGRGVIYCGAVLFNKSTHMYGGNKACFDESLNLILDASRLGGRYGDSSIRADVREISLDHKDNFQRTVLYSGRQDNIVFFSYREFVNEMARPSYTQELRFDLKGSRVIGVKGASIEIIKADNEGLVYRVLRHFTPHTQ